MGAQCATGNGSYFNFCLTCFSNKVGEEKIRQGSVENKAFSAQERPEEAHVCRGRPALTPEEWGLQLAGGEEADEHFLSDHVSLHLPVGEEAVLVDTKSYQPPPTL